MFLYGLTNFSCTSSIPIGHCHEDKNRAVFLSTSKPDPWFLESNNRNQCVNASQEIRCITYVLHRAHDPNATKETKAYGSYRALAKKQQEQGAKIVWKKTKKTLHCTSMDKTHRDVMKETKRPSSLSLTYLQTLLISWLWEVYAIIFDPDPHWDWLRSVPTVQPLNKPAHGFVFIARVNIKVFIVKWFLMNPQRKNREERKPSSSQRSNFSG